MSEEKTKGISLRTKRKGRSAISRPKQISGPVLPVDTLQNDIKLSQESPPPQRLQVGGKTSNLVKQRYSTRFNNLPADFDPTKPPVPSVPSIPVQFTPKEYNIKKNAGRDRKFDLDITALQDPNLRPDIFIASLLDDASEQDINDYQRSLQNLRDRASKDLQQNFYQNRRQLIKISKEAEKLKEEMRALKNLMSDLKINTTALRAASSQNNTDFEGFVSGMSKREKRSSVADRTAIWNSQLQALWKMIEGSQKFLPAASDRHPVQDAGLWIELDNATWKPRRAMRIILLNDHLLTAVRKKRRLEGNGTDQYKAATKLVADRCWPLLDIEIVDLAGINDSVAGKNKVTDAIMIRGIGHETFTYRTEKSSGIEKQSLIINFKKQVEELRKGLRSEMETSNKSKETLNYFASRDPGLLKKADLLETLSDVKDMLIEIDGKQQNLRWIESQVDSLDIDIALQRFDAAVVLIEKFNSLAKSLKSNVVAQEFISFKTSERATKLAGLITKELVENHNLPKKVKCNVNWLTRLGFEDRAREVYLETRSDIIRKRSRQCIFEGDLHRHTWEVSFIYFTIIRNTVITFQMCFPSSLMSACVKWVKEEVEGFNTILLRQLSSTKRGSSTWDLCLNQAREHANILFEVGLDFNDLLGQDSM
ncbi:Exocyst complex component exo84 [Erysiphe necator]|nr:Exocyst complex component exo84 [Erysiphe necator]